jgi:hypothetical protein
MDKAKNWQSLFDTITKLFVDTAALLKECDRFMAESEWKCAHKIPSTVGRETSYSIDKPEKWCPSWVARFYARGSQKKLLPYVAVYFSDRGGTEDYPAGDDRLVEPLIVAGCIKFKKISGSSWYYWHSKYWFWSADFKPDRKRPVVFKFDNDDSDNQAENHSFAVPLFEITSSSDLHDRVIKPLHALIKRVAK